jgi:hypothetical protein
MKQCTIERRRREQLERKAVLGIVVTLIFTMLLTPWIRLDMLVMANPIPIPTILMPEEYINATISRIDGVLLARVNGTYPFNNLGLDFVFMFYPVPPDADKISVKINETALSWNWYGDQYQTIIGVWPFIWWIIDPVPNEFAVNTYYEHSVPLIDGNYTFLYAMGTGKYLDYYAKETTAYVSVKISKDVADNKSLIDVYTIGYNSTTEEWTWKPAEYNITNGGEIWIVTLTVVSEEFHPLVEDLLITIKASIPSACMHVVPNTLNLKNEGQRVTCYIELPEGYDVGDIDVSSILLNDTIPVDDGVPAEIGDYDSDGILDLMVQFNRTELTAHIYHVSEIIYGNVTLTITGQLTDGTLFEGSDTVEVMFGGDADFSGYVEMADFFIWRENFGKHSGEWPSEVNPDFDSNGIVDLDDFFIWRENFGATVPPPP